jgi:hypothetical protein
MAGEMAEPACYLDVGMVLIFQEASWMIRDVVTLTIGRLGLVYEEFRNMGRHGGMNP